MSNKTCIDCKFGSISKVKKSKVFYNNLRQADDVCYYFKDVFACYQAAGQPIEIDKKRIACKSFEQTEEAPAGKL